MLNSYLTSSLKRKPFFKGSGLLHSVKAAMTFTGLLTGLICMHVQVCGQPTVEKTKSAYNDTIDVFKRINKSNITNAKKRQNTNYTEFISTKLKHIPFDSSLITINRAILPSFPIRVYLGKLSMNADSNDYVFIIVKCKKYQGPEIPGKIISYVNDTINPIKGSLRSQRNLNWYAVRAGKNMGDSDRIVYRRVDTKSFKEYKRNFKDFMKRSRLANYFPVSFVILPKYVNSNERITILPTLKINAFKSSIAPPSKARTGRDSLKAESGKNVPEIEFLLINGLSCCKSPPEEDGTSGNDQ